jgi:hypothetical protein
MTRKRSWWPVWVGVGLLAALILLLFLRAKAPPEAARLLPESDAILYANLRPLRALTHWGSNTSDALPVPRSREFQGFVDATGVVPERDLDSVALALHRMPDPHGPNGAVAYSEVFIGHFDAERLRHYLATLATSTETYANREIYSIPVEKRTLRVAVVAYDIVAASNTPTSEQIHSILDRSRASALWRPGSSLLATRFGEVPLLAQAWGIGRIGLPFAQDGRLAVMGFELPVPVDTELIASLRYSGAMHLRVEEIAPDTLAAQHTAESVNNILSIVRGLASAEAPHSPKQVAMRDVLSSVSTTQRGNRAVLTAVANLQDARALASADQVAEQPASESPGGSLQVAPLPTSLPR